MSDHSSDPQLDAQLRDVPLAENFLDRLKRALVPSDQEIDERLRKVRVPGVLASRLRAIPEDVTLDGQILAVAAPPGLDQRLRAIPHDPALVYRKPSSARRAVEAAGLAAGLSLGLASAILLIVAGAYPAAYSQLSIAEIPASPELPEITIEPGPAESSELVADVGPFPDGRGNPPLSTDAMSPGWGQFNQQEASLAIDEATSDLLADASPGDQGPVGEWTALSHGGLRMMDDVVLLKFGVLGSPQYTNDLLPEFETPWIPTPRGVEPPLVRGYDRVFFLKNRVSPLLSPGAHPELQTLAAPLSVDTRSFRRAWRRLEQGEMPRAAEIRVEDFLAALDYHWPSAAKGELALRTAAGPSPFAAAGAGLLQVGVQAGEIRRDARRTTHLVLAIDASKSMDRAGRWTEVAYAVNRTLRQLTAGDHLSLVVFHDDSVERWEDIGRDEAETIARELGQLKPSGGSNLALGLQQAVSVALSQELAQTQSRRIVLITDDPTSVPGNQRSAVREMLLSAGAADVGFDVIDLGEVERSASLLSDLASELDGDVRRLADGRAIYWLLLERLAGKSSIVASEAKLTIRFNPQAVAAYRLIGHEANALAGLSPPSLEAEMQATEAATALVELWLQPGDVDEVAEAIVTWIDPQTSELRKRTQRISRLQFAPTFSEAAPSLQAAAIAAETAELLRGSREALRQANPELPKPSWARILATASEANPVLEQWPDFRRMVQLSERAEAQKP